MDLQYTAPIGKLLTCGSAKKILDWSGCMEFGLSREHIPELIRMPGMINFGGRIRKVMKSGHRFMPSSIKLRNMMMTGRAKNCQRCLL